jgi:Uma2 family endonuclease
MESGSAAIILSMAVRFGEGVELARAAVRFPVELRKPPGFLPDDPSTWPAVQGRLEVVGGRLFFMPPCADYQQDVAISVAVVLGSWSETRGEFVVGGNEAGMVLGGEARAADAAVWRRADVLPRTGKLRRVPPLLAVEIAGEDEDEDDLRPKARWYLEHGVGLVWIVLPKTREVIVIDEQSERRFDEHTSLPPDERLPGLVASVSRFFAQLG